MRKITLLFVALLLCCISMIAQQRSESEAIQIAQEFFGKKGLSPKLSVVSHQKVDAQVRKRVAGARKAPAKNQSFYVVNDETNNRFVIVSADERMYQILGYSDNGAFSAEEASDGLLFLLDEYNRQYELVSSLGCTSASPQKNKAITPIAPLLSTKWHQIDPYWLQCPQYSGEYCVTGCVATAMAQVMAFHRYPDNALGGSLSYKTSTLGLYQYLNFDSQHFDWNKIQNTYGYYYDENGVRHNAPERTAEEKNEVAKLMHACGVSVFMDYNISANGGSGAYPFDIPYALIHYFGYNPNIYYASKDYYKRVEWDSLIVSELNANRPVIYGGHGSLGGHSFVLDGVDDNGRYHFNFGWNGNNDGYFELDAISPSYYNFSSNQTMILLVSKDVVGTPSDVFYTENFTLGKSATVGSTIKARFNPYCYSNSSNTQTAKFKGEYGVGVFDKNWNFVKSLYSNHEEFHAWSHYVYSRNVDVRFDASTFTDNSAYYIALYAQSDDSSEPTRMRTSMGANDWYRAITKDGVVNLDLLGIISSDSGDPNVPEPNYPLPLTGNLKVLALDKAGEYKIWDVSVVKDGSDTKKYWFKGFDQIVTDKGYSAEQNHNTIYGIYGDDGSFTIPIPQELGNNLFLNNFSSDGDLDVSIAQDGTLMKINDTWGTIERKKSGDNTTQEEISVYTSTTYYPKAPVPVETPIIVVDENHKMTIACGTEGAIIYYTLDGNTPTTSSQKYSTPINISRNLTIKAIAVTLNPANTSEIAQLSVNDYVVSTPIISESNGEVSIKCSDADAIYYTTDGSTPTKDSEKYTISLELNATKTIKAIGTHEGWHNSDVATYEFIITPGTIDIVVLNNIQGQLASRIPAESKFTAKSLTITGELNGTDITVIREMLVNGNLEYLDIKGSTIKAGGEKYPYLSLEYETSDNVIGWCMFARAKNLKAIVLPENTLKIDYHAFGDCELLKEVTIPEGCTEIDQAFSSNRNLETVNLPSSLVRFASNNFAYCPNVKAINVDDNNLQFKSVDGVLYSKDGKRLIRFANNKCQQYNIINGTVEIGENAFYCSNVEFVNIPTSVTVIGKFAFYSSKKLKEILIPNSVREIGYEAFQYCSDLTSLTLSSQITKIEEGTFLGCYSLKSVFFPENIKEISPTAFNYCYLLQRFEVDNSNPYLCSDDGVIYSKDKKTIVRCPIALYSEDFKIGEGVETIADNAFMGCKNIQKFTLPMSVDSIGKHSFEKCSITSIQLSDNVQFIGYEAFNDCDSLKSFVVPTSLKEIAQSMLISCGSLSYVKIHAEVTKIGSSAFRFDRKLSTIECAIKNIDEVEVGNLAFDGIPDDCTWYIPLGTEEKYKACSWWVPTWKIVSLHENLLTVSSVSLKTGQTVVLPIELTNDDLIRMLQFELRLPEGVSVLYDDEEEDYAIDLSDRATKHHTLLCSKLPNGNYQFVLSTMTLNNLSGNEGAIAYITIKADENLEDGIYEAYLSNIELTAVEDDSSLKAIRPNDFPFEVIVEPIGPCPFTPGDVNGDGKVTITDAGLIVNYILGKYSDVFNDCAADVNGDGSISITDAGEIVRIILGGGNAGARAMKRFLEVSK